MTKKTAKPIKNSKKLSSVKPLSVHTKSVKLQKQIALMRTLREV